MKTNRDPLDRLLKSAASAPGRPAAEPGFAMEARTLGAWRAAAPAANGDLSLVWLRRATIGACILAVASLAWNYTAMAGNHGDGDELAVADAAMRVGVEP